MHETRCSNVQSSLQLLLYQTNVILSVVIHVRVFSSQYCPVLHSTPHTFIDILFVDRFFSAKPVAELIDKWSIEWTSEIIAAAYLRCVSSLRLQNGQMDMYEHLLLVASPSDYCSIHNIADTTCKNAKALSQRTSACIHRPQRWL